MRSKPAVVLWFLLVATVVLWLAYARASLATATAALGALLVSGTDFGVKGGATDVFALSKLLGIALILGGFLVSIEAFRELRIPFTKIRIGRARREEAGPAAG